MFHGKNNASCPWSFAVLKFNPPPRFGAYVVGMLDLSEFGHIIREVNEIGWCADPGHDQFCFAPAHPDQFDDLLFFQKLENKGVQDFIADQQFGAFSTAS